MASLDFKSIRRELDAQGWTVQKTAIGHWRCAPPDRAKPIVHISGEGGDPRSIRNSLAELRRSGLVWNEAAPPSRPAREAPAPPEAPEPAPRSGEALAAALVAPPPLEPDLDGLFAALKEARAYQALARAQAEDAAAALRLAEERRASADCELAHADAELARAKEAFDRCFADGERAEVA